MVAALATMLADAAPAIVGSLGVSAAKGLGSQLGSGAGKAASDALFNSNSSSPSQQQSQNNSQQQNNGLFGAVGNVVDGAISLPAKAVGGVLGTAGNVLSGVGNFITGTPSDAGQQKFIAMQQQGYR